jgi:predicted ATPase/DNA-binding NarL/FixJ family response regulator
MLNDEVNSTAAQRNPTRGLPVPLTPLVGRERERLAIMTIMARDDVRLLTLTGPGGVGKTRLALQAAVDLAEAFADDVVFIPLATIRDPALVVPTIAMALGLQDMGSQPLTEHVIEVLRSRQMLLVLDNLEQVLDATPHLTALLIACPHLKLLATSRSVLHLSGEHDVPVAPLALPPRGAEPALADVAAAAAVRLFVARAQAARPDFVLTEQNAGAVAAVCQRLDGLPLAVELAASRMTHLSPASLLDRLDQRLPLLTGGSHDLPVRLQTMRGAIAWSYDLLAPQDQALFRALSLFVGGFTLQAAEAIGENGSADPLLTLNGVASLVAQSLLHHVESPSGGPRYAMLETIREYAREQLDASGETEEQRRRHAICYLELAEAVAVQLDGATMAGCLTWISTELPNLRSALAWSMEPGGDAGAGLRVAAVLSPFWRFRGYLGEGRQWLDAFLAIGPVQPTTRIDGLVAAAELATFQGEYEAARALGQAGLDLATAQHDPGGAARAWFILGLGADFQGDLDRAVACYREAVSRSDALGASNWTSRMLACLADVLHMQNDLPQAEALAAEALALARAGGHAWSEVLALGVLAHVAVDRAAYAEGLRLGLQQFAAAHALGAKLGAAGALGTLAGVVLAMGQLEQATRLLAAGRALGDTIGVVPVAHHLYSERVLADVQHGLGESLFASTWAAGSALTPEEALADLLAEPEPFARHAARGSGHDTGTDTVFTPREREVLRLVAAGRSNREIAGELFVSVPTVKRHLSNILGKLDLPSRSALNTYAHNHGLA